MHVGPGDLLGIYVRDSSGNVENCAFYGFRESTPGPENAFPITVAAIQDGEVNVRVASCTFADNYGAIFCWGLPDRKYINVTIENNIIQHNNESAGKATSALWAAGTIRGNTIRYNGDFGELLTAHQERQRRGNADQQPANDKEM